MATKIWSWRLKVDEDCKQRAEYFALHSSRWIGSGTPSRNPQPQVWDKQLQKMDGGMSYSLSSGEQI